MRSQISIHSLCPCCPRPSTLRRACPILIGTITECIQTESLCRSLCSLLLHHLSSRWTRVNLAWPSVNHLCAQTSTKTDGQALGAVLGAVLAAVSEAVSEAAHACSLAQTTPLERCSSTLLASATSDICSILSDSGQANACQWMTCRKPTRSTLGRTKESTTMVCRSCDQIYRVATLTYL